MVLVRRKRVLFHDVPDSLKHLVIPSNAPGPSTLPPPPTHVDDREVFYIPETGEIFLDYEAYAARMTFYKLTIFMCEVTGKTGLDYFQAAESERNESTVLHARFPEQLKAAVLRAVQWQIVGRLDHLVEAVHDRYKDRYFKGEKVYVDVQGDKYLARIVKVFPPRNLKSAATASQNTSPLKVKLKLSNGALSPSALLNPAPTPPVPSAVTDAKAPSKYRPSPTQRVARSYPSSSGSPLSVCHDDDGNAHANPIVVAPAVAATASAEPLIHTVGVDLKLSLEEANKLDDPNGYYYSVQMIGEGEESSTAAGDDEPVSTAKYAGSEMEVTCSALSRDRLEFNKALLKRFLKDALERTNAIASPWVVKKTLAEKYGIETEMPVDVKQGVEGVKKADHEKRKRVWEERGGGEDGSSANGGGKKRKLGDDEKANRAAMEAERQEALERMEAAAEDALKKAAAAKKRGIRYPTEDLDVRFSERDRKAGKIPTRPAFDKDVPFGPAFESFLMTWNFLTTFGKALNLSSFTLDEYEKALRHSVIDPPCRLIAEIHVCLINLIQERPFERHAAIVSLMELKDVLPETKHAHEREDDWWVEIDELLAALAEVGVSWESSLLSSVLKAEADRDGWECLMVGVLKDHATTANFPRLRPIMTSLVYGPSPPVKDDESETGSVVEPCHPADRYPSLPAEDKIAIIQFLCNVAIACKPIRAALDGAEADLTDLRKEKIEVNRERKRLAEELNQTNGPASAGEGAPLTKGNLETISVKSEDAASVNSDMDVDSDRVGGGGGSDAASDFGGSSSRAASTAGGGGGGGRKNGSNPTPKSIAHANQRARAREKAAGAKALQQSSRRKDDDVTKLDRRLEAIEREFRQMLGLGRSKPLGRDRFYNRIWWFDGLGASSLVGHVPYGTGRVFIQGPSEVDLEVLKGREDYDQVVVERRKAEEGGETGMLAPGEWACYSEPEQLEAFMTWINIKGHREFQLDRTVKLWWDYMIPGMKKRLADIAAGPRIVETASGRRSSRGKAEMARESYMTWTNKRKPLR